ncbi:MAG: hypothetical protein JWQ47_325 [Glaciihabitans sp.]|nr:hypothetical protein [Glaciihabitans sp.]
MSMSRFTTPGALRVPQITILFWIIKGLSTAMGEATSDYFVTAISPVVAVLIGFVAFLIAMAIQFTRMRYIPWAYWLAVVMVGVFGTMVADVLHVGFGIAYVISAPLFALVLAAVFIVWRRVEGTLSIHEVNTTRREVFYWLAVVSTFALGTAAGDLTATVFQLGYLGSAIAFAIVMLIPVIGFASRRFNAVFAFWFAYVLTRPLGASIADWFGKPSSVGGLGIGSGIVALVLTLLIAVFVGYLSVSRVDVQDHSVDQKVGANPPTATS